MKTRVLFYCAAVVALVLFLAAVPSHATERRDPFVMQDATQAPAAKPTSPVHPPSHKKAAPRHTQKQGATSASVEKKNTTASGRNGGVHDSAGSSSAAK